MRTSGLPVAAVVYVALLTTAALAQVGHDGPPSPWVPGRIIVTLDPAMSQTCMHCAWENGWAMGYGLDELASAWGVTDIQSLHAPYHAATVDGMVSSFNVQHDLARQLYPERAARELTGVDTTPILEEVLNTYVVQLPPEADPESVAASYRTSPAVLDARPDYNARLLGYTPSDPFFYSSNSWAQGYPDLWGIRHVSASAAWQLTRGAGIRIGMQDTGEDRAHIDLSSQLCINSADPPDGSDNDGNGYVDDVYCGYDFAGQAVGGPSTCPRITGANQWAYPCDQDNHGSHTAGTALGAANGVGIIGVAPEATLQPLKIFGFTGSPLSGIYNSFLYAINNGTDVINASWGCTGTSCHLLSYVQLAYLFGIQIVAAAGNDATFVGDEPASIDDAVFTVGADDEFGNWSNFSNFGNGLDIVAPGGGSLQVCTCGTDRDWCTNTTKNVLSARSFLVTPVDQPGCTITNDLVDTLWSLNVGTSMAAPHASGAVALMMSRFPWMTLQDIQWAIKHAASDVTTAGAGVDAFTGWGQLDVGKAVNNTVVLPATEDAWTDNSQKNANFGNSDLLRVQGSSPRRITFLKFDLRNIAAHQGASLRICTRDHAESQGGGKVYVVDPNAWSEYVVTWNNQPVLSGPITASIIEPVVGTAPQATCMTADITPYVHPRTFNSFAIAKDTTATDAIAYWSRESAPTDHTAELVVTTCVPTGCRTCNGATVVTANIQLLPLLLSVVLYQLYDWRRRRHANHRGGRVS